MVGQQMTYIDAEGAARQLGRNQRLAREDAGWSGSLGAEGHQERLPGLLVSSSQYGGQLLPVGVTRLWFLPAEESDND